MSTAPVRVSWNNRGSRVEVGDRELTVWLVDGRRLIVPLEWFPRLLQATPAQRENWEVLGDGEGFHWPDVDEDISVSILLTGRCTLPGEHECAPPRLRRSQSKRTARRTAKAR